MGSDSPSSQPPTHDLNATALLFSAVWIRLAFVFLLVFDCFSAVVGKRLEYIRVLIIWQWEATFHLPGAQWSRPPWGAGVGRRPWDTR